MSTVKHAVLKNTRHLVMENKATGTVTTKGEILMQTAGLAVPATLSTVPATLLGVCDLTISVLDALVQVPVIRPSHEDTFIFSTTNATNVLHNGQVMVLGASSTLVNNTGTTNSNGIVQQVEPYGATGDNLILGRFITL